MITITPKPGFDWSHLVWSRPESVIAPLCSYCSAPIPEDFVPLILWDKRGSMVHFCKDCMQRWWGFNPIEEDPDG